MNCLDRIVQFLHNGRDKLFIVYRGQTRKGRHVMSLYTVDGKFAAHCLDEVVTELFSLLTHTEPGLRGLIYPDAKGVDPIEAIVTALSERTQFPIDFEEL